MMILKAIRPFHTKIPVLQRYLESSFSRSSGPGGQNVNKLNTKVELRFVISQAQWLPENVKSRLYELKPQYISQDQLIVTSQVHRTQEQNLKDAMEKVQSFIDEAAEPVKLRVVEEYKEPEHRKDIRIKAKRREGEIKTKRGSNFSTSD